MPTYKLKYFDLRARGELTRLIFVEAGQEYEDQRFSFEEWPKHKPNMPFGQAPVLCIDGKRLCQSGAIARYLAREFKLDGKDAIQSAFADMMVETLSEHVYKFPFMEKDAEKKAEAASIIFKQNIHPMFEKIEARIKEHGGGYLIAKDVFTYADLAMLHSCDLAKMFDKKFLDRYPNIKALVERVAARPNIQKWLEKRPTTLF